MFDDEYEFEKERYVNELIVFLIEEFSPVLYQIPRAATAELIDGIHENLDHFKSLLIEKVNLKIANNQDPKLDENDLIEAAQDLFNLIS